MEPFVIGIIGVCVLLVLLLLRIHIGISLALVGFAGSALIIGVVPAAELTVSSLYHKIATFSLMTLPLFILMGLLASGGGVSKNLFDGLATWLGKIRGGLGMATAIASAAFGTISGSAIVNATVFSKVAGPETRRYGYDKKAAYGICASAGAIGMLIPPSILMVIYGSLSGDSIGTLLVAGTIPGLILTVTICGTILLITYIKPNWIPHAPMEGITWKKRFAVLPQFWPVVVIAVIIFGGIFGGVFSPTEAGAVACFVMFIIFIFLRRGKAMSMLKDSLLETVTISAMIFLIFGSATIFSRFLVLTGVSDSIQQGIMGMDLSVTSLIIIISCMYLVMGCFLDGPSMICITVPIFSPAIGALGIDTIWYAMVAILAMHVGLITPPVGLDVYAAQGVAEPDVSIEDVFAGSMPFFVATLVALVIIIAFPWLSTFLPSLMVGS